MTTTGQYDSVTSSAPVIHLESSVSLLESAPQHYDLSFTGDCSGSVRGVSFAARASQFQEKLHSYKPRVGTLPDPRIRYLLRANWKEAREAASAMTRAAKIGDQMDLGIAADALDRSLSELWELRSSRDANWKTILNHLQGVMKQFFALMKVELLTVTQCEKILVIVNDYLGTGTKSADDLNETVRLIEDAEFDPYTAISGDPL